MTQSGYRVSKLQQSSRNKRKRMLKAVLAVAAVLAFAIGALFVFGVVHLTGSGRDGGEGLSFLVNPASNQAIDAASVNILVIVYEDRDPSQPVQALLLASYGVRAPGAEFSSLPPALIAHAADGKAIKLSETLKYGGGKTQLATSEVQRLLGEQVHYTLALKVSETVRLAESLGLPDMPDDQSWSHYLPSALASLGELRKADLASRAREAATCFDKSPSFSSPDQQSRYVVDMFEGFAAIPVEQLAFRKVPGVEILNGCGAPGIGEQAQAKLESYGFAVSDSGRNAKKAVNGEEVNDFGYDRSVIYYHTMDAHVEAYARWLQAALNLPAPELREDAVLGEGTITLIVGKDLVGKL